jgi:transposase-like protein
LLESGKSVKEVTEELGVSDQSIYTWRRQYRIDSGQGLGLTTTEVNELNAARRRIKHLETELAMHELATELLKATTNPKSPRAVSAVMVARGHSIQRFARILGAPESSFYAERSRTPSARSVRHAWPTDLISQVHTDARGVYGSSQGARETHEGAGDQGELEHRGASYATLEYSGHHRTAQASLCPTTDHGKGSG